MKNWNIRILATVLVLLLPGCSSGENRIAVVQNMESMEKETNKEVNPNQSGQTSYKTGKMGDNYILPDSQTHVYTIEELSGLTEAELRLARNEIYARRGRRFKSDDLIQYFTGKSWYYGSIESESFTDELLTQIERDNLKLIQMIESAAKVCSVPKIGVDEFPVIDGSTATLPISQAIYRMATGASVQETETAITHGKTTQAWISLFLEEDNWYRKPDLVIAYEPGEQVWEAMEESGKEVLMKPIGRDALVFLVNCSNLVKSLTSSQIVDIYTGSLDNWKDVGGKNQTIQAFQRPVNSGSQNLMEKLVMKGLKMADSPMEHVAGDMGELIESVSAYDNTGNALGYSVYYYARNMYQKPDLNFLAVDGVIPSNNTIRNGSYPYVNDFYAAIRADEPKDSKAYELYEWLTTEDGQSLINGLGYVGIGNMEKELPKELTAPGEAYHAAVPLPEDYVILASGEYLYGESGIGVFDSSMNLLQFIGHVESSQVRTFLECSRDAVIPIMDTRNGQYGHYSIRSNSWVDTEADNTESQEYQLAEAFADNHPELLQKYGITKDDVRIRYYSDIDAPFILISNGNMEHYYDVYGKHMLDFNTAGDINDYQFNRSVNIIDHQMAYMSIMNRDTMTTQYQVYRNGQLDKELISDETGEIGHIRPYFYTKNSGNYLYIYNYQDEPCAKFLFGYADSD